MEKSDPFMKNKTFFDNIVYDNTFGGKEALILQVTSQFLFGWDYENTFLIGKTLNYDSLQNAFL